MTGVEKHVVENIFEVIYIIKKMEKKYSVIKTSFFGSLRHTLGVIK